MDTTEKIHLEKLYKETLDDCGQNPSKEFIKQEFLFALKEKGQLFLKTMNKTKPKNPKTL